MAKGKKNGGGIQDAVGAYFKELDIAAKREDGPSNLLSKYGMRYSAPYTFWTSSETLDAKRDLFRSIIAKYGEARTDEKMIDDLCIEICKGYFDAEKEIDLDEATNTFVERYIEYASKPTQIIFPCGSIKLEDGLDHFALGPVAVCTGEHYYTKRLKGVTGPNWMFSHGATFETLTENNKFVHQIGSTIFKVDVIATPPTAYSEAQQLALAFQSWLEIRSRRSYGSLTASVGDRTLSPGDTRTVFEEPWLTARDDDTFLTNSSKMAPWISIGPDTIVILKEDGVDQEFDKIASADPKTLGARISAALSWYGLARTILDPSHRFALLFTAIEALLTDPSPSAPVTDTIARNASTIISTSIDHREKNAKIVRDAYRMRSKVIHNGARSATRYDVKQIEYITHILIYCILKTFDIGLAHGEFLGVLRSASYGVEIEELLAHS